jgi:hypothetical protein
VLDAVPGTLAAVGGATRVRVVARLRRFGGVGGPVTVGRVSSADADVLGTTIIPNSAATPVTWPDGNE